MYVHFEAWQAATFYRGLLQRPSMTILEGSCSSSDRRRPLLEIDSLRNHHRIWVLFSPINPLKDESPLILKYLDTIGDQRDSIRGPGALTSSAVLYELDAVKVTQAADASQWAIPDAVAATPMRGCWPMLIPQRLVNGEPQLAEAAQPELR